ncbi:hypothetical protein M2298_000250 [Brevibacillus sp. 1238]|jgi:hypothetical protein|nr:hypothetical protein [Brevibacillus sp. 1238]
MDQKTQAQWKAVFFHHKQQQPMRACSVGCFLYAQCVHEERRLNRSCRFVEWKWHVALSQS